METTFICPACGDGGATPFLDIPQAPVHLHLLWRRRADALAAPRGDIRLAFCRACGHIWNVLFRPELMTYQGVYENSLHFSPTFQRYAEALAADLVRRYDLHGKNIVEIGSGRGDFLKLLCELGDNRGIGFDPSEGAETQNDDLPYAFVRDFYSARYAHIPTDFVCCRHTLEHIPDPLAFLHTLRGAIGEREGVRVFFEVPDGGYMLRQLALWDIIYEHCSFFTRPSLIRLFARAGFETLAAYATFGEQFLCLEAAPALPVSWLRPSDEVRTLAVAPALSIAEGSVLSIAEGLVLSIAEGAAAFPGRYVDEIARWRETLRRLALAGRRAVVWGAGSKGIMFLNLLPEAAVIEYVVDINPRKQGMFVTGAGQEIVLPDFLASYRPDAVIVMNRNYAVEIADMLAAQGIEAELLYV